MKKFVIPKISKDVVKTIRINEENVKKIEEIASKENTSFNRVVNEMIKFALENM